MLMCNLIQNKKFFICSFTLYNTYQNKENINLYKNFVCLYFLLYANFLQFILKLNPRVLSVFLP